MVTRRFYGVLSLILLGALTLTAQQFESVPQASQAAPQAAATPAAAGAGRIGVINFQLALTRTQEGQKALQELEAKFTPRQQELQKLQDDIRGLEEQGRTQERTLSDDARVELARQLDQKRKQLTRMQQDLQDEVQDAQSDYINTLGTKMQQVLNRYARENNLAVIFNVAAPGGTILQWSPAVDITEQVIGLYDQTHPVQSAAGGQKPPAAQNKPQQ